MEAGQPAISYLAYANHVIKHKSETIIKLILYISGARNASVVNSRQSIKGEGGGGWEVYKQRGGGLGVVRGL